MDADLQRCVALGGLPDADVAMVALRGRPRIAGSRRPAGAGVAPYVPPGCPDLRVMPPYSPLPHLLALDCGIGVLAVEHYADGGRYVAETLVPALEELEAAWFLADAGPAFHAQVDEVLRNYVGRPTPLTPAPISVKSTSKGTSVGAIYKADSGGVAFIQAQEKPRQASPLGLFGAPSLSRIHI